MPCQLPSCFGCHLPIFHELYGFWRDLTACKCIRHVQMWKSTFFEMKWSEVGLVTIMNRKFMHLLFNECGHFVLPPLTTSKLCIEVSRAESSYSYEQQTNEKKKPYDMIAAHTARNRKRKIEIIMKKKRKRKHTQNKQQSSGSPVCFYHHASKFKWGFQLLTCHLHCSTSLDSYIFSSFELATIHSSHTNHIDSLIAYKSETTGVNQYTSMRHASKRTADLI